MKENKFVIISSKAWNDSPLPTRNLESLNSFKSLINTKNTKVTAHYYVGCRLGQILHARLRMNCSALNAHLFIRNLLNRKKFICGITETVSHFLLDCPRHTTLRQQREKKKNVCKHVVESYTIYLKVIIQRDCIRLKNIM
jgi:hypothetical protein